MNRLTRISVFGFIRALAAGAWAIVNGERHAELLVEPLRDESREPANPPLATLGTITRTSFDGYFSCACADAIAAAAHMVTAFQKMLTTRTRAFCLGVRLGLGLAALYSV